jgi:hypothetical protein
MNGRGEGYRDRPVLADDAVLCETVSAPNSLLTGKNTGKFAKPRPSRRPHCFRYLGTPRLSRSFPTESNRQFWGRNREVHSTPKWPSPPTQTVAARVYVPANRKGPHPWRDVASIDVRFAPESDRLAAVMLFATLAIATLTSTNRGPASPNLSPLHRPSSTK